MFATNITEAFKQGTLVIPTNTLTAVAFRSCMNVFTAAQTRWKEATAAAPTPVLLRPFASTLPAVPTANVTGQTVVFYDSEDTAIASLGLAMMIRFEIGSVLSSTQNLIFTLSVVDGSCADPNNVATWSRTAGGDNGTYSSVATASNAVSCFPVALGSTPLLAVKTTNAASNFGFIASDDFTVFTFSARTFGIAPHSFAYGPFVIYHPRNLDIYPVGTVPRISVSQIAGAMLGTGLPSITNQNEFLLTSCSYGVADVSITSAGTMILTPPILLNQALPNTQFPGVRIFVQRTYPAMRFVTHVVRRVYVVHRGVVPLHAILTISGKKHIMLENHSGVNLNSTFSQLFALEV